MQSTQIKPFLAGVLATGVAMSLLAGLTGFQANSMKVGVIDFQKVANESPFIKSQEEGIRRQNDARIALLDFMNTYPTITREQATTFRKLSLKTPLTDAERAQLDKLKADVQAEEKKFRDLQTKANPTQEDLKAIEAYRTRVGATREAMQQWGGEFRGEMNELLSGARTDVAAKVRSIVAEVGRKEGYSVIYDINVAPYAANDVTKAAAEAVAKAK